MKNLLLKSVFGLFLILSTGFLLFAQENIGKAQSKKSIADLSYAEGGPKGADPGAGLTNVYYADSQNGDDTKDGKTPETAWKSESKIQSSKSLLVPGTMLLLKRGSEWEENIRFETIKGTESAPIVFGAYGDLLLPNPRFHRDFFVQSSEFVMVRDLEFAKINTALSKYITIYNNVVHGSAKVNYYPSNAVMAWGGSSHIAMVSNFVYDLSANDGLVVHGSAEGDPKGHVWIVDNVVIGNSGMEDGIDLAMSETGSSSPCIDVKVIGNRVQMEAVPGISTKTGKGGMLINGGHGGKYIWIVGNTMGNSGNQGVNMGGEKDYVFYSGNVIFSAGNKNTKNSIELYNTGSHNWFEHNTVLTTTNRNSVSIMNGGKEVTHNLFFRTDPSVYLSANSTSKINFNWYGNQIGNFFSYKSFADWQALGHDINSNNGLADGIMVPVNTTFNSNPFNWKSSEFLSHFIPGNAFPACKGNDTPGAFDCSGKRLGLVIPPLEGLENDGLGWEGPQLVKLKLEELAVDYGQGTSVGAVLINDVNRKAELNCIPNPANDHVKIRFNLPFSGEAILFVHNIWGEKILQNNPVFYPEGQSEVEWKRVDAAGRILPNGIYFVQLQYGNQVVTDKLMLHGK